jgi:hypothetical protein
VTLEASARSKNLSVPFQASDALTGRLDVQLRVPARTERSDADFAGMNCGSRDSGS